MERYEYADRSTGKVRGQGVGRWGWIHVSHIWTEPSSALSEGADLISALAQTFGFSPSAMFLHLIKTLLAKAHGKRFGSVCVVNAINGLQGNISFSRTRVLHNASSELKLDANLVLKNLLPLVAFSYSID